MPIVVQKYGGSSLSDAESIKRVASRITETRRAGSDVCVVVSAMGDSTDELLDLAQEVSPLPRKMIALKFEAPLPTLSVPAPMRPPDSPSEVMRPVVPGPSSEMKPPEACVVPGL